MTAVDLPERTAGPTSELSHPAELRIPLVIGVTGHRNVRPEHVPALKLRIAEIFADLRSEYPNTPWIVMSPLAEGADQIVADVAVGMFKAGDRLAVPLPMPREAYAQDFVDDGALAEFDRLAAQGTQIEVWRELGSGLDFNDREERDRCYTQAGAYVVRHCQILIALWSKHDSGSPCGTARMIEYRRRGLPARFRGANSPFGLDELGPVYLIVTPRKSMATVPDGALGHYEILPPAPWDDRHLTDEAYCEVTRQWAAHRKQSSLKGKKHVRHAVLTVASAVERKIERFVAHVEHHGKKRSSVPAPTDNESRRYRSSLENLDRFNALAAEAGGNSAAMERSKSDLLGKSDTDSGRKHRDLLGETPQFFINRYALADMLAIQFQRRQRHSLLILCVLVVFAGGLFHWYAHMARTPFLLLGYLAVLFSAFCLFVGAKRGHIQQQYLDYRALAEGMRVGLIWELVGIKDCVADHYLQQQRSELDWIRFGLRNWQFAAQCGASEKSTGPVTRAHYEMATVCWVHDQAIYHSRTSRHRSDIRKLFELEVLAFFLAGTVLAIVIGLRGLSESHRHIDPVDDYLIVFIGFTTAVAAAIAAYAEKMGIAAESRHFARMVDLFMHASRQMATFDKDRDTQEMNDLLLAIGKEALDENGLWVILHRERPIEVPVG